MAIKVKKITLWRGQIDNRPGTLAGVLEPLAAAGADLQVVMGYREPGQGTRAVLELSPVVGKRAAARALGAGLSASSIPTLLVTGDNRAGLGSAFAQAIGAAGINMAFLVAQVVGRKFSAIFGFENDSDATQATAIIKRAAAAKRKK